MLNHRGYIIYNPLVNMDLKGDPTAVLCVTTVAHAK